MADKSSLWQFVPAFLIFWFKSNQEAKMASCDVSSLALLTLSMVQAPGVVVRHLTSGLCLERLQVFQRNKTKCRKPEQPVQWYWGRYVWIRGTKETPSEREDLSTNFTISPIICLQLIYALRNIPAQMLHRVLNCRFDCQTFLSSGMYASKPCQVTLQGKTIMCSVYQEKEHLVFGKNCVSLQVSNASSLGLVILETYFIFPKTSVWAQTGCIVPVGLTEDLLGDWINFSSLLGYTKW